MSRERTMYGVAFSQGNNYALMVPAPLARAVVRLHQAKAPGPTMDDAQEMVRLGWALVTVPAIGAVELTEAGVEAAKELAAQIEGAS